MATPEFPEFLAAIRAGDESAAAELVRRHEPYIRRVIRLRLHNQRLRRLFDSMDICQSILASFFAHATAGEFDLQSQEQLQQLLVRMALNKLVSKARAHRNHGGGLPEGWDPFSPEPSPSEQIANRDLAQAIRVRLSEEDLQLFHESKVLGRTWEQIGEARRASPNALRMRLARAIAQVKRELAGEEVSDER